MGSRTSGKAIIFLLMFAIQGITTYAQDNFFSVNSLKKKIEILNQWSAETTTLIGTPAFRASLDYSTIYIVFAKGHFMMGFKDSIFTKYFGKTFSALTPSEMMEVVNVIFDKKEKASKNLNINTMLAIPFLDNGSVFNYFSSSQVDGRSLQKAKQLIIDINKPIIENQREPLLPGVKLNIISKGTEEVAAPCAGMKVVEVKLDINKEASNRFMVSAIQLGSPAYMAGLQPGDVFTIISKPQATTGDNYPGFADINSLHEFHDLGCNISKPFRVAFNILYKNAEGEDYRAFSGNISYGLNKAAGEWVNAVTATSKPGNASESFTQYDELGKYISERKRIKALRYQELYWPDRPQFSGIADTISRYNDLIKSEQAILKVETDKLPCLYNYTSYAHLVGKARMIDHYILECGNGYGNWTEDDLKKSLKKMCTNEWWNIAGNPMTPVVRDLLADDEAGWKKHKPTEMNPDTWESSVMSLFTALERKYNSTCLNQFPEPTDTFFVHVDGTPDQQYLMGRNLLPLTLPGIKEKTYYYYARKKFSPAYVATLNHLQNQNKGLEKLLNFDYKNYEHIINYIATIVDKYGCQSPQVKELEQQLFKAIVYLWPEKREVFLEQYRKWSNKK